MAEQFLTLMADLDEEAQARMSGWYRSLQEAGFVGVQTPGLPYHISLSTFPLEQEKEAARQKKIYDDKYNALVSRYNNAPESIVFYLLEHMKCYVFVASCWLCHFWGDN